MVPRRHRVAAAGDLDARRRAGSHVGSQRRVRRHRRQRRVEHNVALLDGYERHRGVAGRHRHHRHQQRRRLRGHFRHRHGPDSWRLCQRPDVLDDRLPAHRRRDHDDQQWHRAWLSQRQHDHGRSRSDRGNQQRHALQRRFHEGGPRHPDLFRLRHSKHLVDRFHPRRGLRQIRRCDDPEVRHTGPDQWQPAERFDRQRVGGRLPPDWRRVGLGRNQLHSGLVWHRQRLWVLRHFKRHVRAARNQFRCVRLGLHESGRLQPVGRFGCQRLVS